MKVYEIGFPKVADTIKNIVLSEQEGTIVEVATEHWLATGRIDGTYSEEVRQKLGIPIFQSTYMGGTCVVFPGDISFCELRLKQSDFGKQAIVAVKNYLKSLGFCVVLNGNDLMLYSREADGLFKVASYGSGRFLEKYLQTVVHISIGMDEELVGRICVKDQKKKPMGLGRYGITAESIYKVIKPVMEACWDEPVEYVTT